MQRAFPHYQNRIIHDLDGVWEMAFLGDLDPANFNPAEVTFDRLLAVPGVWDTQPGLEGRRGLVALRKELKVTPHSRGLFRCGGLGIWGQLIVDGRALAEHPLPYAAWEAEIPASSNENRELILLIDNRFGTERTLLFDPFFDWYAHGGVYRSTSWHELPDFAISRCHCRVIDLTAGSVELELQLNGIDLPQEAEILVTWDENPTTHEVVKLVSGTAKWSTTIPNPRVWSPCQPNLHLLHLQLGVGGDMITERIGLRTIEARDSQLWLNGKPLRLEGVNRHEAQVLTGPVLSDAEKLHDILMLKDLGCNFVRGSHYQQDQRFLDLCDEVGLLFWEEGTGWQPKERHFTNPQFLKYQRDSLRAMVQTSFNHPSVIIWGLLNEGDSFHESSRPVYEELTATLRSANDGRLVTYACNHPFACRNLDLVDLVSINVYPGWYPNWNEWESATDPQPFYLLEKNLRLILEHLTSGPAKEKPKIISEIGAGAIYGWRDQFASRWTEQFQAKYLEELFDYLRGAPGWQGLAIWHFSDARTYQDGHALGRPRAFNNKGLLDEYRRPKQAYQTVAQGFAEGVIRPFLQDSGGQ